MEELECSWDRGAHGQTDLGAETVEIRAQVCDVAAFEDVTHEAQSTLLTRGLTK